MEKSGVYKLSCYDCNASYIGQITFTKRVAEYKTAHIEEKLGTSSFANHLIDKNHTSKFNPEILHTEKKGLKLTIFESLEIRQILEAVNEFLDIYKSPLIDLFFRKTT